MTLRSRVHQVFRVPRVLLPVIHPIGHDEAISAVDVCVAAGVRGVFLIDQGMRVEEVLALAVEVHARHPGLWVGLNLLALEPVEALRVALERCAGRLDGLWSDDAHVHEGSREQPRAQAFVDARRELGWDGLYFGGVAFKYRRPVPDEQLAEAARVAADYMDVVCTSGAGTGIAAHRDKLARMRQGLAGRDGAALALASGVTLDNVADYLGFTDAFLVGTGIEREFGVLDPDRVARLQARIDAG